VGLGGTVAGSAAGGPGDRRRARSPPPSNGAQAPQSDQRYYNMTKVVLLPQCGWQAASCIDWVSPGERGLLWTMQHPTHNKQIC
jgi:hypothetical protein